MAYLVGENITFYEEILSAPFVQVTFPAPTPVEARVPVGSGVSVQYFSSTGLVTGIFTPDKPGQYYFVFSEATSGNYYQNIFDVDPLPDFDPSYAIQYLAPSSGTSLADIRRELSQKLGDYREVVATGGSVNTITDTDELYENTNYFRGGQILFLSGSNAGLHRRIVESATASSTITFAPPLPVSIAVGDVSEIFNVGMQGARIQDYKNAINNSLRDAYPQHRVKLKQTIPNSSIVLNRIPIPIEFTHISRVVIDFTNGTYELLGTRYPDNPDGFWIDHSSREVVLNGIDGSTIQDRSVTLYGDGKARPLSDDNDLTTCDTEWLVETAKSYLALAKFDQTTMAAGQAFGNRADQLRSKMTTMPDPNTIEI